MKDLCFLSILQLLLQLLTNTTGLDRNDGSGSTQRLAGA